MMPILLLIAWMMCSEAYSGAWRVKARPVPTLPGDSADALAIKYFRVAHPSLVVAEF
jgi:hypothetical protein